MNIFCNETWININETLKISSFGNFKDPVKGIYQYDYESSNGHRYKLIQSDNDDTSELILVEELVAKYFIQVPETLNGKPVYVKHANGDYHDNFVGNLRWQEFVETWVPLQYPKVRSGMYEVSNIGRVKNIFTNKILRADESFGYKCYGLAGTERSTHSKVFAHCLVAKHFVPGWGPDKNIVNHISRNRGSANFMYLEWVSQSENVMHGVITGATNAISTEDADMIRDMLLDPNYGGNPTAIYDAIDHDLYPNIKIYTIKMIKGNKQCRRSNKYDLNKIKFIRCNQKRKGV